MKYGVYPYIIINENRGKPRRPTGPEGHRPGKILGGTRNEKEFFDTIPGVVRLDSRVAIYVPSTTDTDHPTDNRRQVEEVAANLSAMFGGATATEARGYWVSQSAGLVGEAVTIVYSNAAAEDIERHGAEIVAICRKIKREMKQEAVSLEINGELFLV